MRAHSLPPWPGPVALTLGRLRCAKEVLRRGTSPSFIADARRRPDEILFSWSGFYGPTICSNRRCSNRPRPVRTWSTVPTTGVSGHDDAVVLGRHAPSVLHRPRPGGAIHRDRVSCGPSPRPARSASPKSPSVPTLKELGVDLEYLVWVGVFVPKHWLADTVGTIDEAVAQAVGPIRHSRMRSPRQRFIDGLPAGGESRAWWASARPVRLPASSRACSASAPQ